MGKTSLATNIAFHVARNWKGEVTPTATARPSTAAKSGSSASR